MMSTTISVIIATKDRRALLAETLKALAAQRWPSHLTEILVADNGSSDGTRAVVEALAARPGAPQVIYLSVPEPGKSHAVNAALRLARGAIIAFTDDDVLPEPTWLEHLAAAFDETGADFVAGRIFPRWEVPPPAWMSPALYGVLAVPDNGNERLWICREKNADFVPIGANMAVRASVVRRLGGLRPDLGKLEDTLRTGEDHEFYLRMLHSGYQGVYEPSAAVRHWVPRPRLERAYFRRWLYQNGRDVARLQATYPSPVRLFGVPRYLWRAAAQDALNAAHGVLTLDARRRFAGWVRLLWLAGYLRERWLGSPRAAVRPAMRPVVGR